MLIEQRRRFRTRYERQARYPLRWVGLPLLPVVETAVELFVGPQVPLPAERAKVQMHCLTRAAAFAAVAPSIVNPADSHVSMAWFDRAVTSRARVSLARAHALLAVDVVAFLCVVAHVSLTSKERAVSRGAPC